MVIRFKTISSRLSPSRNMLSFTYTVMIVTAVYYLCRPTPSFLTAVQAIENSGADTEFLRGRWLVEKIIPLITYDYQHGRCLH